MMRLNKLLAGLALAGLLGGALAGCQAEKQPTWDYGKAYHAVFNKQKLDPNAGDDSPVIGMDGTVAAQAYDRYEKAKPSEKENAYTPILNIGKGQ